MTEESSNMVSAVDSQAPIISFKKRRPKAIRKRSVTPPPTTNDDDDDEADLSSSSEDNSGQRVKRRKMASLVSVSSKPNNVSEKDLFIPAYSADRETTLSSTNNATAPTPLSKNLSRSEQAAVKGTEISRDSSKNSTSRTSHDDKNTSKKLGPVKAAANVRTITIQDYQPDVCKDYKQTGFCGFGDSCKFLHAREDYKQSWQLEKEWEISTKGKDIRGTVVASAGKTETEGKTSQNDKPREDIPFACVICKGPYKYPIVTGCGHYFCEPCALKRYKKDPTCAICGAGTGGVFNTARKLKQ